MSKLAFLRPFVFSSKLKSKRNFPLRSFKPTRHLEIIDSKNRPVWKVGAFGNHGFGGLFSFRSNRFFRKLVAGELSYTFKTPVISHMQALYAQQRYYGSHVRDNDEQNGNQNQQPPKPKKPRISRMSSMLKRDYYFVPSSDHFDSLFKYLIIDPNLRKIRLPLREVAAVTAAYLSRNPLLKYLEYDSYYKRDCDLFQQIILDSDLEKFMYYDLEESRITLEFPSEDLRIFANWQFYIKWVKGNRKAKWFDDDDYISISTRSKIRMTTTPDFKTETKMEITPQPVVSKSKVPAGRKIINPKKFISMVMRNFNFLCNGLGAAATRLKTLFAYVPRRRLQCFNPLFFSQRLFSTKSGNFGIEPGKTDFRTCRKILIVTRGQSIASFMTTTYSPFLRPDEKGSFAAPYIYNPKSGITYDTYLERMQFRKDIVFLFNTLRFKEEFEQDDYETFGRLVYIFDKFRFGSEFISFTQTGEKFSIIFDDYDDEIEPYPEDDSEEALDARADRMQAKLWRRFGLVYNPEQWKNKKSLVVLFLIMNKQCFPGFTRYLSEKRFFYYSALNNLIERPSPGKVLDITFFRESCQLRYLKSLCVKVRPSGSFGGYTFHLYRREDGVVAKFFSTSSTLIDWTAISTTKFNYRRSSHYYARARSKK